MSTNSKVKSIFLVSFLLFATVAMAQWQTNGNNIYNTNVGCVGIGTSSPQAKTEIKYTDPTIYGLLVNRYKEISGGDLNWAATIKEFNSTGGQMLNMSKTLSASTSRTLIANTLNSDIGTLNRNISGLGTELTKLTLKNWNSRLSDEYLAKVYLMSNNMNDMALRLTLLNSKTYAAISKLLADYSVQLAKRADLIAGLTTQQGTQTQSTSDKPLLEVRTETLYTSGALPAGTPNPEIKSKLTLTSLGYLGINNGNPQAPIDVQRTSGAVNNPIAILGPDTRGMQFVNILTLNSYNKIVAAGDQGIFWTGSYGLVIAPKNTTATSGIRIANNGNVGIGISNPQAKLHVNGNTLINGTTTIGNGTERFSIGGASGSSLGYSTSYLGFNTCRANNTWTFNGDGAHNGGSVILTNVGGDIVFSPIPSTNGGTQTLTDDQVFAKRVMWIESSGNVKVKGKVWAKEVEVTLYSWPDYVFAKDYRLKTLNEVEMYIKEHNHLPDMPSESEVIKNGAKLGEMNALLLQKIEELTLYVIDLKKENDNLKNSVEELKNK